jgi:hypothetical protein
MIALGVSYSLRPCRDFEVPSALTKVSGSLNESLESNKGFRIVEIESEAVE